MISITLGLLYLLDFLTMIYVAKFVVLSCLVCRAGYVEHAKRPGERVTSFKLAELSNMAYVHQGALQTWLGFQVTDTALP